MRQHSNHEADAQSAQADREAPSLALPPAGSHLQGMVGRKLRSVYAQCEAEAMPDRMKKLLALLEKNQRQGEA